MTSDIGKILSFFASTSKLAESSGRELAVAVRPGDTDTRLGMWPHSDETFRLPFRMIDEMRRDDAAGSYAKLKKNAIFCAGFSVKAFDNSRAAIERKEFIDDNVMNLEGSLVKSLKGMMTSLDYGFSWTNAPLAVVEDGPFAGKVSVRALKVKRPHSLRFIVDDYLNVIGLSHDNPKTGLIDLLPIDEFIIHTYESEFEDPYGTPDFTRAFPPYTRRKFSNRFWTMYLERFAGGFLKGTYKAGSQTSKEHAAVTEFFSNASSPRLGILTSDNYSIDLLEAAGRGSAAFKEAVHDFGIQIARSMALPDLLGFSQTPGGALALGKKHVDTWIQVIEDIRENDVCEIILNEQFVKRLIDLNYGPGLYPRFVPDPITSEQKDFFITKVAELVKGGIITKDLEVENRTRAELGLSPIEELPNPAQPFGSNGRDPDEEEPEEEDEADMENEKKLAAPNGNGGGARKVDVARVIDSIKAHPRAVLVGGPRSGKTSVAVRASERYAREAMHPDNLIDRLEWSALSSEVATWLDKPGEWVMEGVATVRAVRKWLAANPGDTPPPFTLVWMGEALQRRSVGQSSMSKGIATIWNEILPELTRRRATIIDADETAEAALLEGRMR
jgi:hypothetical protein